MKKGSEWFELLSEKEQQQFKDNYINEENEEDFNLYLKEDTFASFSDFIFGSFHFVNTKQGHKYWFNISKRKL
jgi:hypothetical protein